MRVLRLGFVLTICYLLPGQLVAMGTHGVGGRGPSQATNVIRNGSFEDGLVDWQAHPATRVIHVGTEAEDGAFVLELDMPTGDLAGYVLQDLTLEPDREYELSYKHQRSFSETRLRLPVTLDEFTPFNLISRPYFLWSSPDQSMPSAGNWRHETVRFFGVQSQSQIQFGPITVEFDPVAGGKVWVDDIQVTALGTYRQAGTDHDFVPFLPSGAVVGEAVELRVSCVDLRLERVTMDQPVRTSATIDVTSDDASAVVQSPIVFNGETNKTFTAVFNSPGVHRVRLSHLNGHERLSNPIRVTATEPASRHYWGDTHIHTKYHHAGWWGGDGHENYWFARDMASLDYAALSEHFSTLVSRPYAHEMALATEAYHEPGTFVTFYATESHSFEGHDNYIVPGDDPLAMFYPSGFTSHQDKLEYFRNQGTATLELPHHFSLLHPVDWRIADRDARTLVELYSDHGSSEVAGGWWRHPSQAGNDYSASMGAKGHDYLSALARGYRLGVIGCSDDHKARPGFAGLTCVLAPELDRDALWDNLQARHCYATTNARVLVDFAIQGTQMGDELFLPQGTPLVASIRVNGTADITMIEIVSNGQVLETLLPGAMDFDDPAVDLGDFSGKTTYFYLRVYQQDEHRAWSSPIWVSPSLTPDLVVERKNLEFDYSTNTLIVRAQNYGDVLADTTVRVFESDGASAIQSFQLLGDERGVVVSVEPLSQDRALVKVYLYIPEDDRSVFDFSGSIHIADATGYSIVTDPRSMLVDDGNGTLAWDDGPYGYLCQGRSSHSGRITDFAILVNTQALTTVDCSFASNGIPIGTCYLGDQAASVPGNLTISLGAIATQTETAQAFVSVPPHGQIAEVTFNGLAPGKTYVVVLDPEDGILESDERNNSQAWFVPVQGPVYVPWPLFAAATFRNAGLNPASYTSSPPVLGSLWSVSVDLSTTAHSRAKVFAALAPGSRTLPGGQLLLVGDPTAFVLPGMLGPLASQSIPVPDDLNLLGLQLFSQAIHLPTFGAGSFALSNAQDLVLGR